MPCIAVNGNITCNKMILIFYYQYMQHAFRFAEDIIYIIVKFSVYLIKTYLKCNDKWAIYCNHVNMFKYPLLCILLCRINSSFFCVRKLIIKILMVSNSLFN